MENDNTDDLKVDPMYKTGFEQGYWLRRGNNPHLNEIIEKNANGNSYHKGLLGGKKQAEREAFRGRLDPNSSGPYKDLQMDADRD